MSLTFFNFEKTIEKSFFYEKNPRIAAGVSGGPDSLALCFLIPCYNFKKKNKKTILFLFRRSWIKKSFTWGGYFCKKSIKI